MVFIVIISVSGWGFVRHPTGFLPTDDQGYAIVIARLPDGAAQPRVRAVTSQINDIIRRTKGISAWVTFGGYSVLDSANVSNISTTFIVYDDWSKRGAALSQDNILANLRSKCCQMEDAVVFVMVPPPIRGLGQSGGFQMMVEDRQNLGLAQLQKTTGDHSGRELAIRPAQRENHLQRAQPSASPGHRPDQGPIAANTPEQCV